MDRKSIITKINIAFILVVSLITLVGCAYIDEITGRAGDKTQENIELIDDFLHGEDVDVGLNPDVKFDTYSAQDAINDAAGGAQNTGIYDEKSGQYVTKAQYRANSFVDSLKSIWGPLCISCFVLGFVIRRINHSSAAIRKFALFIELVVPVIFTALVYTACALADSEFVSIFDRIF